MNHISILVEVLHLLSPEATPDGDRHTTSSSNGHPAGGTDLGLRNPLLRASGSVVVEPGGQPGGSVLQGHGFWALIQVTTGSAR